MPPSRQGKNFPAKGNRQHDCIIANFNMILLPIFKLSSFSYYIPGNTDASRLYRKYGTIPVILSSVFVSGRKGGNIRNRNASKFKSDTQGKRNGL